MYPGLKTVAYAALVLLASVYSQAAIAQPRVAIVSPAPEQILPGPDVTVHFRVHGAHLRPGGSNVHFMLDNEPFEVQFNAGHPHVFKDVAPGTHTIRAFVANTMHEAIRGSLDMVTFSVAYPDTANRQCPGVPTLTYNLPQGEYLGLDAGDVTLDYLVSNVTLAPGGNKVVYYVDGRRFFVEDGMPRHLTGLRPGYHVVRVELQDKYGDLIGGPFNSVERTILLSPDKDVNSAGVLDSKYPRGLPHVASIKGSMTMGRPWVSVEKPRPMTQAQVRQSQRLTVRRSDTDAAAVRRNVQTETEITEAPEVTNEVIQSETRVIRRDESEVVDPNTDTVRRTDTAQETRLTTSGRRLDDRLDRAREAPVTTTLRADSPTTGGRSTVHRIPVASTVAASTATVSTAPAESPMQTPAATPSPSPTAAATPVSTPAPTPTPVPSTPTPAPSAEATVTTSSADGVP